jgi:hypothetical protein
MEPTDDETKAPPPGFRMVAGDAMRRSLNDKGGELNIDSGKGTINPVQFVCGTQNHVVPYPANSDGTKGVGVPDPTNTGAGVGFPDVNCDGYTTPLRYDIHFPSCYNPALPLDDYKHNTAYPSSMGATHGQNCPPGWIHIPHLFFEVYWNTPRFADLWTPGQGTQPFVLAQGDPTGYGLHGDFVSLDLFHPQLTVVFNFLDHSTNALVRSPAGTKPYFKHLLTLAMPVMQGSTSAPTSTN